MKKFGGVGVNPLPEWLDDGVLYEDKSRGIKVSKHTLRCGRQSGVEILVVENGPQGGTCVISLTHGGSVHEFVAKNGMSFNWEAPGGGLAHPAFCEHTGADGLGWLEGFGSAVERCGLVSNGPPVLSERGKLFGKIPKFWEPQSIVEPLHGRIARIPVTSGHIRVTEDHTVEIKLLVLEGRIFRSNYSLLSTISFPHNRTGFKVRDVVTNHLSISAELALIYHNNILVPEGTVFEFPLSAMCPRDADAAADMGHWNTYPGEKPGAPETAYLARFASFQDGKTAALAHWENRKKGFRVGFNTNQLPFFCLWKHFGGKRDGRAIGFEPGKNFPRNRDLEREAGRYEKLGPGRSFEAELDYDLLEGDEVVAAIREIETIRTKSCPNPTIRTTPDMSIFL